MEQRHWLCRDLAGDGMTNKSILLELAMWSSPIEYLIIFMTILGILSVAILILGCLWIRYDL